MAARKRGPIVIGLDGKVGGRGAQKASVTLSGIPLAATGPIAWRFTSGVAPYSTTFTVHQESWDRQLKKVIGQPLELKIVDSRGVTTTIRHIYILHRTPSDSPYRVSFVVADKRWQWPYKGVAKDFNIPRKTGDRTALNEVPIEAQIVVDEYDYLPYSLKDGDTRWTAKEAVEHVLEALHGDSKDKNKNGKNGKRPKTPGGFRIESFPIVATKKNKAKESDGEFSLQNVMLRDQGDAALSRLLGYIPGTDVYVDAAGDTVVYDATDLDALERHFKMLPDTTYDGDRAAWVDRKALRPANVFVHYQREVEVLFDYSDDLGGTAASPDADTPFLENVIPTVDPSTTVTEFDPVKREDVTKTVPPGTWLRFDKWLDAMDGDRPDGSLPWTFDTIRRHWLKGDLDGALGAGGLDRDDDANVAMRVQAIKQHFRQTFRINRQYMERVRSLQAVRVALLDPVTGARAPAAVWGQACIIPSAKGHLMAARRDDARSGVYRNVDYLAKSKNDKDTGIIETAPGPAAVNIVDRDLGIFRVEWLLSPYGDVASFVPCHLVDAQGQQAVVTRDLAMQDEKPMGAAMQVESGTNGIFLRDTLEMKVMMTIVPNAPNNSRQFHKVVVHPNAVAKLFRTEFRIQAGTGPDLEVFVPPGEATARFAFAKEDEAQDTIAELLGLGDDDPDTAGIDGPDLPGYVLSNEARYLSDHAISLAAELLAPFADNVQGVVATPVPRNGVKLVGNMAGATIRVAAAPSAKVDAVHQFPGQQRSISRFGLMSTEARAIVLGIVPLSPEK